MCYSICRQAINRNCSSGIRAICIAADRLELRLSVLQIARADSQNELTEHGAVAPSKVRYSSTTIRRPLLCWPCHCACSIYLVTISVASQPFVFVANPICEIFRPTRFNFGFELRVQILYLYSRTSVDCARSIQVSCRSGNKSKTQ